MRRLLFTLALAASTVAAQGTHPLSGRKIAGVMGFGGADWLERPERIQEENPDAAIEALDLKPGMSVADVGADRKSTRLNSSH